MYAVGCRRSVDPTLNNPFFYRIWGDEISPFDLSAWLPLAVALWILIFISLMSGVGDLGLLDTDTPRWESNSHSQTQGM